MSATITPSRFMFEGKEYIKHDYHGVDPIPCNKCDFMDSGDCGEAPPCDRKHNQGQQVYFKLEKL